MKRHSNGKSTLKMKDPLKPCCPAGYSYQAPYGTYGSIGTGSNVMPYETRLNVFLGNIAANADYEGIKC